MRTRTLSRRVAQLISRRDFLKIGGAGLFGVLLAPLNAFAQNDAAQQGRVIPDILPIYETPSLNARKVRDYWHDMVFPITEVTIGDQEPAYNRVWYRLGEAGYAHSGSIQPVRTMLNQPTTSIPVEGALAEVTVPFTDAHLGPGKNFPVSYRYYYETTHWVIGTAPDSQGQTWYHILEDKWDNEYYAPASHFRLIPAEEISLLSPDLPETGRRLEVLIASQAVIAYEWDRPVFIARAATGAEFSNGNYATPTGRHLTFHKRPSRHMAAGNLAFNGYDLPGVPWNCYITRSGIAFHGTYWHNDFGKPRSHGCINLTPSSARWLFRWTLPTVPHAAQSLYLSYGTPVDIL
jgi:hypothetical protein